MCVASRLSGLVLMLAGLVRPLISYLLWSANIIADLGSAAAPNNTARSGGARHRVRGCSCG
ncbi:MAG: hypothetical protein ACLT2F_05820 [Butyricicoccus sp.]